MQRQLADHVRHNNQKKVERIIGKFGVDIPDAAEGMTGLMIAAQHGKIEMARLIDDNRSLIIRVNYFAGGCRLEGQFGCQNDFEYYSIQKAEEPQRDLVLIA